MLSNLFQMIPKDVATSNTIDNTWITRKSTEGILVLKSDTALRANFLLLCRKKHVEKMFLPFEKKEKERSSFDDTPTI